MKDTVYKYDIPVRTALLADLHDCPFGEIISSLEKRGPELICIAGDAFHRAVSHEEGPVISQSRNMLPFLRACAQIAPAFFSPGNHEWRFTAEDIAAVADTGVKVLDNCFVSFRGMTVGGLSSASYSAHRDYRILGAEHSPCLADGERPGRAEPETDWLADFCSCPGYKLLLCHHPEYRDIYLKDLPIDLILCGHAHGGQIRLFGRGLYAPGQGAFPKYTSGVHGNMIISKGLANTGGMIPRLFNPREVVYIEPE
ncbi:MAG: metallophosphoesterase [Ruminococcus sp.]|nr:metallophosphoesterase [Ruminococcus sp.]